MDRTEPFYIEVITGSYIRLIDASFTMDLLEYSYDKVNWYSFDIYQYGGYIVNVNPGDKVYMRAKSSAGTYYVSYNNRRYFTNTQGSSRFNVGGNIMSLLYGDQFAGNEVDFPSGTQNNFYGLFQWFPVADASKLLLPASTLTSNCYARMFESGWAANRDMLVKAPIITQATIQSGYPYDNMFRNCNSLESITIENTNIKVYDTILYGVSPKTIVYKKEGVTTPLNPNHLTVVTLKNTPFNVADAKKWKVDGFNVNKVVDSQNRVIWERYGKKDPTVPFYMENTGDTDISMSIARDTFNHPGLTLFGSTDKVTWNQLGAGNNFSFTVPANSKLYLQATFPSGLGWGLASEDGLGIRFSGNIQKIGGNIMSLIYGTNFADKVAMNNSDYTFCLLFANCVKLADISELILPATTLSKYCYFNMFAGCTSLTDASMIELPATTLSDGCYNAMFHMCSGLTEGPDLPAKVLTNSCYGGMFYYCSSLNSINCYATDISASGCLTRWVDHVPTSGTIVKKSGVTYPTGISGIPTGWTVIEV